MRARLLSLAAAIGLAAACCQAPAQAAPSEGNVLAWINWARAHPAEYADMLREYRSWFQGRVVHAPGDETGVATVEGVAAVDEAIAYVERQRPLPPLEQNDRLTRAAEAYAGATGPSGRVGHVGPHGETLMQRIRAVGVLPSSAGEVIAYGPDTSEAVVRQLIIDDGVPSRGHRMEIFDPGYRVAGVGCGRHRVYRTMCVVDFAGALAER
ncbi:CAP domain-containing protein [Phenylobacterium montanum]|uniref:SCP domain-containing protein n=1 Tax=Phenylobacterium montanum TaxID=2823693 RepID=A0A975FY54_9CAUL|nr:CAP domain-containing protein [Caulobacter sp. S6]QUD86441.1 hypothetical protein KCG34_15230 [Caulobacter sp. S6]